MSEWKFSTDPGHVGGLFLKFPVHLTRPVGRLFNAVVFILSFLLDLTLCWEQAL